MNGILEYLDGKKSIVAVIGLAVVAIAASRGMWADDPAFVEQVRAALFGLLGVGVVHKAAKATDAIAKKK